MLRAPLDRTWDVHWSGPVGAVDATSEVTGATKRGEPACFCEKTGN